MRTIGNSRHLVLSVMFSLWAVIASCHVASADSFTWTGNATGNNWNAGGGVVITNWINGGFTTQIPDSNDTVLFNSTLTGPISVNLNGDRRVISATLEGSNPITLSNSINTLELTSGDITAKAFSSGYTIQSGILLLSTGNWEVTQTSATPGLTVSGVISGSPSLIKTGSGTLLLTGNNTYSGTTTISDGTIQLGTGGFSGSLTGNISNNSILEFNRSGAVTYAGAIFGSGTIDKNGSSLLILTGNNSFSGTTNVNNGTLQIGSGGSSGSLAGDIVNSTNVIFNRSSSLTYSGDISGTGTLSKQGNNTLVLTGNNTYAGTTTINSGTLQLGNGGATGSISGNVSNNGSLVFNRSGNLGYSGTISGGGSVTKDGDGTLTMTSSNSYVGGTYLTGGVLSISANNQLGSVNGSVFGEGGALRVTATHATSRNFVLTSDSELEVVGGVTYTASGLFNGSSMLTKTGSGTLVLSGNNVAANNQSISAGTLQVGNGGTSGSLTGDTLNNATLTFNRSDDVVYDGEISGTGNLIKLGSGKLTLSGNSSYVGPTSINAGILLISTDANLGAGGNVTISNSTLKVSGTTLTNRDFQLQGVATFDIDTSVTYTVDGTLSSSGALIKSGDGTLVLNGVNSYPGGTTVSAGTLMLDSLNSVGTGPLDVQSNNVTVTGGTDIGVLGLATPDIVSLSAGGVFSTDIGEDITIGSVGNIALSGGTINSRRLNNRFGGSLSGSGSVNASILADTGSAITANGDLDLGDATAVNGFYSNGDLAVVSGTTTLHDANSAVFDSAALVTLGDGAGSDSTLAAANGLTLDFGGNIAGFGTVNTPNDSAKPLINNGHVTGNSLSEPITLAGYVKGVGACDNCNITGTDAPGFSPATVNRGSVSYNGTLEIEIGGTSLGDFDRLNHILGAGIADLGGTLDVSLIYSFMPSIGDTFEIITASSVLDTFSIENLPAIGGLLWNVDYNATNVILEVLSPFTADFDQDGDVDGHDFLVWQRGGSPNGTDNGDLALWHVQYGSVLPLTATATAVPEPGALLLLLVGLGGVVSRGTFWSAGTDAA